MRTDKVNMQEKRSRSTELHFLVLIFHLESYVVKGGFLETFLNSLKANDFSPSLFDIASKCQTSILLALIHAKIRQV